MDFNLPVYVLPEFQALYQVMCVQWWYGAWDWPNPACPIYLDIDLFWYSGVKGKGKGCFMGLIQHYGRFRPIVFLSPRSSRIHLQRPHASYRCARPLPAKAGTINNEFCWQICNSRKNWVLLHAAKLGHGTDSFTSPPKEGILGIFRTPKKSNGFGRVWTRELGSQWPVC